LKPHNALRVNTKITLREYFLFQAKARTNPYERRGIEPEMSLSINSCTNSHSCGLGRRYPRKFVRKEDLVREILVKKNVLLFIDNYETIESRESRMSQFLRSFHKA